MQHGVSTALLTCTVQNRTISMYFNYFWYLLFFFLIIVSNLLCDFFRHIDPVQNIYVSIATNGEGWHNYHHVFPWDYRAAELGTGTNLTAWVIDSFAKIGWAYDLKQPSKELIESTMTKKGDGSHQFAKKID